MKAFRKLFRVLSVIVIVFMLAIFGYNIALRYLYPIDCKDIVQRYSKEYGVDQELVFAIIKSESNFDKNAKSKAGAKGLMQLTEETFGDVGKMLDEQGKYNLNEHGFDAEINIKYGTKYLSYLLEIFKDDKLAAIAAYNAGMGNVRKWQNNKDTLSHEDIVFNETALYVKKVLKAEQTYKKLYFKEE